MPYYDITRVYTHMERWNGVEAPSKEELERRLNENEDGGWPDREPDKEDMWGEDVEIEEGEKRSICVSYPATKGA